jgi:CheY-like chemotaxis protein
MKNNESLNLLLVEDDYVSQLITSRLLKELGHKVMVVENGLRAIEEIKNFDYDMIFMDLQMPEMDGITATLKIREEEEKENKEALTIIALTAHAMKSDKQKCLEVGMNDYVSKPFTLDDLKNVIERNLNKT